MKKNKLIGVAALLLALGMVGCGENGDNPGEEPACEHEYVMIKGEGEKAEYHWQKCSKCGEIKDKSEKKHSYKDNADKASQNVAATCLTAGSKWQKCECGAEKQTEVKALGHSFTEFVSTTATCEAAGQKTMKCSRCTETSLVDDAALGHDWEDDSTFTPIAATCVDKGVKQQKCKRTGCTKTQKIETDALGHKFVDSQGTPVDGYATVNSSACERGDSTRIYWSAKDLTLTCKNDKRLAREATEEAEAFYEPNYVEVDDGIRFWGRPIRNAMTLSDEGRASQSSHTSVYDPAITGSYFEYKFNVTTTIPNAMFISEYQPTSDLGTNDLYKANSGDWTPGLESDGEGGSKNLPYRFEIKVDNDTLVFDYGTEEDPKTYPCPSNHARAWFTFPTNAVKLDAGEHTVRISMAGGYLHTFYNFGFQSADVSTGHVHSYVKDTTLSTNPTCTEDGRYYAVCSDPNCGMISDRVVSKLGHDYVEETKQGVTKAPSCIETGMRYEKCSRCPEERTTELGKVAHTYEAYAGDADHTPVPVTDCSHDGKRFEKCSVCNDIKEVYIPELAHTWGAEVDGVSECSVCHKHRIVKTFEQKDADNSDSDVLDGSNKWVKNKKASWKITAAAAGDVKVYIKTKLGTNGQGGQVWDTWTLKAGLTADNLADGNVLINGSTYSETGLTNTSTEIDLAYGTVHVEAGENIIQIALGGTYNYRNVMSAVVFVL